MNGSFVGLQPFFNDAVAGTVVQVKSGAANLWALKLVNTVNAVSYLQVFGKLASAVTIGSTVPDFVIRLAANESVQLALTMPVAPQGATGLSIAGTTTAGGSTGAAISVTAFYE